MKFGKLLIYLRQKHFGLSIYKMAERIGIHPITLRLWETGDKKPSLENIFKLEKAYGVPHGGLLEAILGTDKRKIYVSHPLRNNIEGNRKEVSEICREILTKHNDVLVLSPLNAFNYLSAEEPRENDIALEQCKAMLELADELWVYGDWQNSEGCRAEIRYAQILKIPIKYESEIK